MEDKRRRRYSINNDVQLSINYCLILHYKAIPNDLHVWPNLQPVIQRGEFIIVCSVVHSVTHGDEYFRTVQDVGDKEEHDFTWRMCQGKKGGYRSWDGNLKIVNLPFLRGTFSRWSYALPCLILKPVKMLEIAWSRSWIFLQFRQSAWGVTSGRYTIITRHGKASYMNWQNYWWFVLFIW